MARFVDRIKSFFLLCMCNDFDVMFECMLMCVEWGQEITIILVFILGGKSIKKDLKMPSTMMLVV